MGWREGASKLVKAQDKVENALVKEDVNAFGTDLRGNKPLTALQKFKALIGQNVKIEYPQRGVSPDEPQAPFQES